MAISDPPFGAAIADGSPDDLPRTLRRERDAREREAKERQAKDREARERERALGEPVAAPDYRYEPASLMATGSDASTVRRLEIPFFHLMGFFLKAVFAAVPALIVLAGMLWLGSKMVLTYFPDLVKMQILILFPPN